MNELKMLRTRDVGDLALRAADLFRDRAVAAGLVDVFFATIDSPVGELLIAGTRRGLVRVSFLNEDLDDLVEELATLLSPRILEAPAQLDEVRRELDEYFGGERDRFELPLDMSLTRGFTRKVLRVTSRIPFGSVSTYKDVARRAGNDRAYRAAGNALGANPIPIVVPCHRVLHADGGLGGYGGGLDVKRFLLHLEHAID